ncbi:C4-dicarboxylate ABC transporter permease [Bacterioplanes sanyensis]|uniref:TRAP transporter small permease protein n=1 Tax=Bacterioplanes sanyensis TaxID=1249553 RepID=A0A222FIP5_9GAMM|nr:TRAP transporter small permease [Bacterioplanes sanyensis]ASP38291.1 C4-dicarboxylate ABC transporter permease [Bacterioplanes sanyensis]
MSTLLRWLHRLEDGLLIALLLAMVLLAGVDILARTLFGGGIGWIPPLLRVMVLWLGLLGALLATRSREHIAIDLINRLGGAGLKRACAIVTSAFAGVVCGVIAWHSQEFVKLAYEYGDQAFSQLPAWPMQLIIPVSFALMALRFALQTVQAALGRVETA